MAGDLETWPDVANKRPKVVTLGHFSILSKTPYDSNEIFYSL